jgi:hypothetical protein
LFLYIKRVASRAEKRLERSIATVNIDRFGGVTFETRCDLMDVYASRWAAVNPTETCQSSTEDKTLGTHNDGDVASRSDYELSHQRPSGL